MEEVAVETPFVREQIAGAYTDAVDYGGDSATHRRRIVDGSEGVDYDIEEVVAHACPYIVGEA